MALKPNQPQAQPGPESLDWTVAVEQFHCFELSEAELATYVAASELSPSERWHVNRVIEVAGLLRSSGGSTRTVPRPKPIGVDHQDDEPEPIALPTEAHAARDWVESVGLAAASEGPSDQVQAMFSLHQVTFALSRTLSRYLNDRWELCVIISPGEDVTKVRCGELEMKSTASPGLFVLKLDPRDPNELVQRVNQELFVMFADRSHATAYFY
jgi:hypothetical protein